MGKKQGAADEGRRIMTRVQAKMFGSYLACLYLHHVERVSAQYQRVAKEVPPLLCVTHRDKSKLQRAGQPFKFFHQPPPLKIIERDARARVCQLMGPLFDMLVRNSDTSSESHQRDSKTVRVQMENLIIQLREMAAPYMESDRRTLGHDAWMRQLTRGRVYAAAAKDLQQLLDDYDRFGGEISKCSYSEVMLFNRSGERLDRQWRDGYDKSKTSFKGRATSDRPANSGALQNP